MGGGLKYFARTIAATAACYTAFYAAWILVFFASIHAKMAFCAPQQWWGPLASILLAETPQCRALVWLENSGREVVRSMWTAAGATVAGALAVAATSPSQSAAAIVAVSRLSPPS